ncbi:hypothetical protein GGR53DRAFT_341830 [Hypoxylon sp. FL1150]|nr:hypothetical protein GGR53DRAFT_341830 [Hypoxylon sp. FL1150]
MRRFLALPQHCALLHRPSMHPRLIMLPAIWSLVGIIRERFFSSSDPIRGVSPWLPRIANFIPYRCPVSISGFAYLVSVSKVQYPLVADQRSGADVLSCFHPHMDVESISSPFDVRLRSRPPRGIPAFPFAEIGRWVDSKRQLQLDHFFFSSMARHTSSPSHRFRTEMLLLAVCSLQWTCYESLSLSRKP